MTYPEALAWLYARTRSGAARSPQRARALLARLRNPQREFGAVHVVGTNGKGSVCAMLEEGLRASGLRVGRFTSPHLVDFRERVVVDGAEIGEADVVAFVERARAEGFEGAFFDLAVAMAFEHFAGEGVELAVVEAGVGGGGDATMAFERVAVTVLTNVALDHVETLGPTLEAIAQEKAGAIWPGVPVVTGAGGAALEVVRAVALEREAPLHVLDPAAPLFALPGPPRLQGAHQLENARLAAAALRLLGHGEAPVEAALGARWPARLEAFALGGKTVVVDGAHNPAGAAALAASVAPGYTLVFGAFARKNAPAVLEPLLSGAAGLAFVPPPGENAADPAALAREHGGQAFVSLEDGLGWALLEGERVLVAGSLYLAGAARAWLLGRGARPEDDRPAR